MGNEDRVTSVGRQSSIGLVRECQFWQDFAAFKAEVPGRETFYVYDAEADLIRHDNCSFDLSTARSLFTKALDSQPENTYKIVSNRLH